MFMAYKLERRKTRVLSKERFVQERNMYIVHTYENELTKEILQTGLFFYIHFKPNPKDFYYKPFFLTDLRSPLKNQFFVLENRYDNLRTKLLCQAVR